MSVVHADENVVRLIPDVFEDQYLNWKTKELTQFTIIDTTRDNVNEEGASLKTTIRLKRKITSEMMTTYPPSILLMTITFTTTFFKPFFFEAALSMNLTTRLMMTTIFLSKMESLPSTADIKMVDIWLIFCQLVPLTEDVLLTVKEYFREDEREQIEAKEEE